jgi:hypothetical protein
MEGRATVMGGDQGRKLHAKLVVKDRGWIIEKIFRRLAENLPAWGVEAEITEHPSADADVNHFMYLDVDASLPSHGVNTLYITHIDRPAKMHILKKNLRNAGAGVCMSRMTVDELARAGVERAKLCYVTPAHDGVLKPRRTVIGLTTRIRPDGAKRESVIIELARRMRLDSFHFDIIGRGWEGVIPRLEEAGATVRYYPGTNDATADYRVNMEWIPHFDYYLYMGWDEGSMGLLDALAAGVSTIVTPQGFHLDINRGITHSFVGSEDLAEVLARIAEDRNSIARRVSGLTWSTFAGKFATLWRALLDGRENGFPDLLYPGTEYERPLPPPGAPIPQAASYRLSTPSGRDALQEDVEMLARAYTQHTRLFAFLRALVRAVRARIRR